MYKYYKKMFNILDVMLKFTVYKRGIEKLGEKYVSRIIPLF